MTKPEEKEIISMRQLLECGVHFGHQTKRWNPKMKRYIFTARNGIHVIDLQQSIQLIKDAYRFVESTIRNKGSILFIGTKKQAQETIKQEALSCAMPYVEHRWLGGTLTNIATIRRSINKLREFERMKEDGTYDLLSNKEKSKLAKKYVRLLYYLEGIRDMVQLPSAIFIVDTNKEQLAIREARKLNIPIIAIVDTNADPTGIDYPIPANDDAIRAIKLLCNVMGNAVRAGKNQDPVSMEEKTERAEKAEVLVGAQGEA